MRRIIGSLLSSILVTLSSIGALACGDDGGPVSLEALPQELAGATCERHFECCTDAELAEGLGGIGTATDAGACATSLGLVLSLGVAGSQASIASGRIRYDETAAGACIDRLRNTACDASAAVDRDAFAQCDGMFEPLVVEGDACADDAECITGFCDRGVGVEGSCARMPALGELCSTVCSEGSYCKFGQCAALEVDGARCDLSDACASDRCVSNVCQPDAPVCDGR
jgi:hypothetical protein